ncbi:disease resistance protein RPM1-like [Aristolochia californica]|uniref:disease resistance protein RPM1-like n=1 Tax=Aristolochia californica TaxID=171875 RepID=UPI0035E26646
MAVNMLVGNMAEGTVYCLLGKLASILEKEASLLGGVRHEIEEIKQELESMRSFLREVDSRKYTGEGDAIWATQVRDVAYEVEDIIDEFTYHLNSPRKAGIKGKLHTVIQLPRSLFAKHQIATHLQRIKAKVQAISGRRDRYRLDGVDEGSSSHGSNEEWKYQRDSSIFLGEDDIVGLDENRDLLIGWLTEEEQQQRSVLSVVGMGGLGKTTLVNKAYNNQMVKGHFDRYAWISVSQTYTIDELLRNMGKEFHKTKDALPSDISSMTYPQLVQTLIGYLQSKKYVVVLDDVWSIDVWNNIKVALPDNRSGSRIIITTRNVDVAFSLGEGSHVFYLEPLSQRDSWALFCKKAFWRYPNKSCPQELVPLAQIIVEKCEGLPLAIVAVGGLMSSKDGSELEWRKVYNSLSWELSNNPILGRVKSILLLSFADMPYYLKLCFVYCSSFPEDYIIKRKRLIRLWIAEGFVKERRGMTMEEVADTYLKELICRNMLQLAKVNYFGRVKACRVDDIIRDLTLSMCERENFCLVCDGAEAMDDKRPRRLSIQSGRNLQSGKGMSVSHLRSFLAFVPEISSATFFHATLSRFRLLRVLDLQGVPIDSVPDELLELFNLRYLSLKATKVKEIPKSLSSLQNLQTLDLRDTHIERLPSGINKLSKLRHLLVFRYLPEELCCPFRFSYISGLPASRGLGNLSNLQTLTCIKANEEIIQEIRNLTQLRRFSIVNVKASDGRNLSVSISNMRQLLYLTVMTSEEEEPLNLEALYPIPPLLQKLILGGQLDKLPHWFASLSNLSFLSLHSSNLKEDPLPLLGRLPNLSRLLLQQPYAGNHMFFKAGSFPKLKTLSLWELTRVNHVEVEDGAMPSIQQLWMGFCQEIKMLPQGIEYLTTLKQLYLEEMSDELVQSLRDKKSKDHWKVQHIPNIKVTDREKKKIESLA